jgi:hypothetical protein
VIDLNRQTAAARIPQADSLTLSEGKKTITLSGQDLKAITETAGFTANFTNSGIKEAYITIDDTAIETTVEIAKNAKPSDLALRYSREVWEAGATENTKNGVRTKYIACEFLSNLRGLVHERLGMDQPLEHFKIRINLKEGIFTAAPAQSTGEPTAAAQAADLPTVSQNNEEQPMPSNPAQLETTSQVQTNAQSTQEKYSTYSRSEIDRMLKQQAENLTASLGSKISAQTKYFQEAFSAQEKSFNRSVDKLLINVDEFRVKLDSNVQAHQGATKEQMQKFVADVTRELEQFKNSLNKTILPGVKTIEEKLSSLDKNEKPATQPAGTESQSKLLLGLVSASLIMSAISCALQFMRH